ncbi:hypothetical protein JOC34_000305 [Virgibacillus halotolerans]|uniref:hypothetical protein n=1 Tax=Virgibacillus halotolerans TaxID=1071053 RepID=UPI00195FA870|nr:hypothetical protein [Virgibacillus halotolerans]MBM7597948.1 hypothetical protein [Virgibacillus halotolerans]
MDDFKRDKEGDLPGEHGAHTDHNDFVEIDPDSSRNEEFATEITADDYDSRVDRDHDDHSDVNSTYGWIGLALSVVSFFMMPVILGAAGIILGFVSRARGADTLGNIAIAAGVISILVRFLVIPFM